VLVAQDQRATKVAFGYIRDYLTRSPLLAPQVAEVLASEITLTNGLSIACIACILKSGLTAFGTASEKCSHCGARFDWSASNA